MKAGATPDPHGLLAQLLPSVSSNRRNVLILSAVGFLLMNPSADLKSFDVLGIKVDNSHIYFSIFAALAFTSLEFFISFLLLLKSNSWQLLAENRDFRRRVRQLRAGTKTKIATLKAEIDSLDPLTTSHVTRKREKEIEERAVTLEFETNRIIEEIDGEFDHYEADVESHFREWKKPGFIAIIFFSNILPLSLSTSILFSLSQKFALAEILA